MPILDETLALALAEQGQQLAPLDRAVLLAATLGDVALDAAADLPLDRRDRLLIEARIAAFGSSIGFFARCPSCGEGNEAEFDLRALTAIASTGVQREVGGKPVRLHAPTSRAVAAAAGADDPGRLVESCAAGGEGLDPDAVEVALGEAFPLLDVRFEIGCTACDKPFATRFDIVAWLWREVEALAERAIATVDRLARAYGWSERDILALSPARRGLYLARVQG